VFRTYRKVLVISGLIFCLFSSVFAYSGGTGEPNNPYQIATVSDWNDLMHSSADWNKNFIMTADVNLQGVTLTPVGNSTNKFTGVFDGNNHIIRNVDINMPASYYVGLFGYIGSGGRVCKLGGENVRIIGYNYVGGLVGENYYGTIAACYTTGSVTGTDTGPGYIGYIGGLVGWNLGTISASYTRCTVTGDDYVGGLVGDSAGVVIDCYAMGAVFGGRCVGGLVGRNKGTVDRCYAAGTVDEGDYVGGLVGWNTDLNDVNTSFWDIETSGQTTSAGGEGKTTAEMKTLSTFTPAGWDFDYTDGDAADWFIQIDEYPILTWQISPADIYTDGRNNFRDFALFAQYWMRKDCAIYNNYCDWADLNFDGVVDINDLKEFMSYWLEEGIYN